MASLCLLGHLHSLELPILASPALAPIMARMAPVLSSLHNYKVRYMVPPLLSSRGAYSMSVARTHSLSRDGNNGVSDRRQFVFSFSCTHC